MRVSRDLIEHLESLPRGILRHERSVPGIVGAVKRSLDAPIAGGIVESAKRGEKLFATKPMNRSATIRAIVRAGVSSQKDRPHHRGHRPHRPAAESAARSSGCVPWPNRSLPARSEGAISPKMATLAWKSDRRWASPAAFTYCSS